MTAMTGSVFFSISSTYTTWILVDNQLRSLSKHHLFLFPISEKNCELFFFFLDIPYLQTFLCQVPLVQLKGGEANLTTEVSMKGGRPWMVEGMCWYQGGSNGSNGCLYNSIYFMYIYIWFIMILKHIIYYMNYMYVFLILMKLYTLSVSGCLKEHVLQCFFWGIQVTSWRISLIEGSHSYSYVLVVHHRFCSAQGLRMILVITHNVG